VPVEKLVSREILELPPPYNLLKKKVFSGKKAVAWRLLKG